MCARVAQEPGRSRLLHRRRRGAGAAQEMARILGECVRPWGSEGGASGGSAERRERSEAGGEARGLPPRKRGSESAGSTEEAGEPILKGPGGGKGPTGWWSLRRDRWRGHWAGRSSQRDKARERSWPGGSRGLPPSASIGGPPEPVAEGGGPVVPGASSLECARPARGVEPQAARPLCLLRNHRECQSAATLPIRSREAMAQVAGPAFGGDG